MDDAALEKLNARLDLLETQANGYEARLAAAERWMNLPGHFPSLPLEDDRPLGILEAQNADLAAARDMVGGIREMLAKVDPVMDLQLLTGCLEALRFEMGHAIASDKLARLHSVFVCDPLHLSNLDGWISYLIGKYAGRV